MIDLHTHTKNSDGTDSVKELLINAEKMGIKILSITDHDTVKSYDDMLEFSITDYYTGHIIKGCEFSASFNRCRFEVLGYDFEVNKISEWLKKTYTKEKIWEDNIKEFNQLCKICCRKGIKLTANLHYDKNNYPVDTIYYDIIKYEENKKYFTDEEWNDIELFWRKCSTDSNFIVFYDFSLRVPSIEEVSNIIRDAGGKVFVAHIFKYQFDNKIGFLDELVKQNLIDGIEVYYLTFSEEQVGFLEKYCKGNNLLMSGGTDYHGSRKIGRNIGTGYGHMDIDEKIIKDWYNV